MQAAITKYHRQDGLNNKHLILNISEPQKSKIKVPGGLVPRESLLLGLETDPFLLYSHMAKRERALVPPSLPTRALIPSWDHLPKTPLPNTVTLGIRALTYGLGGGEGGDGTQIFSLSGT